jgi:hypothetical protein
VLENLLVKFHGVVFQAYKVGYISTV